MQFESPELKGHLLSKNDVHENQQKSSPEKTLKDRAQPALTFVQVRDFERKNDDGCQVQPAV